MFIQCWGRMVSMIIHLMVLSHQNGDNEKVYRYIQDYSNHLYNYDSKNNDNETCSGDTREIYR